MVRPGTVAVRGRCRRSRWIGRQTHHGSSSSKLTPVREPRSVVPPAAFIFSVSLLRRCRHFFSSVPATSSSLSSSLVHSFVRSTSPLRFAIAVATPVVANSRKQRYVKPLRRRVRPATGRASMPAATTALCLVIA